MVQKSLSNCEMFKLLQNRKESSVACALSGQLLSIEPEVSKTLEFIKVIFPNFTEHGIQHSLRIIEYIYNIMSEELKHNISDVEIFCFIMSAFFHDMGMALDNVDDREKQRANHHLYAKVPIDEYFNKNMKTIPERERIKQCILFISEAHGRRIEEIYKDPLFGTVQKIEGQDLRYGFLTVLLRIGDLMDLEESRVCEFNMHLNPGYYTDLLSLTHNERHMNVITYNYNSNEIYVEVSAATKEEYNIWNDWLNYLDKEIMYANTHYFVRDNSEFFRRYKLPRVQKKIKPTESANYLVEEIKFQVDETGALWDILTQSVYTKEFDYIRELIQNAIDAVLLDKYLDENLKLEKQSPRCWNCNEKIIIAYSKNDGVLFVGDTGIGMDEMELSSYLFKAADSGYKYKAKKREFEFPAIAKFGIGFVACLTKADRIQILTQSKTGKCIKVEIESNSTIAFIEKDIDCDMQGTFIRLDVKNVYTFEKLKKHIYKYFAYPSVGIKLIDLDTMKALEHLMDLNDKTDIKGQTIEEGYKYIINANRIEDKRKEEINRFLPDYRMLDEIRKLLIENRDLYSIKRIEDMLNSNFYESQVLEELKRIIKIAVQDKNSIIEVKTKVTSLYDKLGETIKLYPEFVYLISNNKITDVTDYKYLDVELNEDFEICQIYKDDKIKHLGKRGIIYVATDIEDYDIGIEWKSVNAFLYNNGKIVKNLFRISSEKGVESDLSGMILSLDNIEDADYEVRMLLESDEDYYDEILKNDEDYYDDFGYTYDVILQKNNDFRCCFAVDGKMLETINEIEAVYKDYSFFESIVTPPDCKGEILQFGKSKLYQDGILIEFNPQSIVPIGVGYVTANLTGTAKFDLNVSRHELVLSKEAIEKWIMNCGKKIQSEVAKECILAFDTLGLEYEINEMICTNNSDNDFENEFTASMENVLMLKSE